VCEKAKVVDEEGRIVPLGQKGELCIRGYGVMRGYWNDSEQTARVIGPDRWYKTGYVVVV
jgi:fatty-acyl-CoA synthase